MAVTHVLFLAGGNGRNPISGAEHHVIALLHELAARGVDVELIVLLWQTDPIIEAVLDRLRAAGVKVAIVERRAGRYTLLSRLIRALDCWWRLSVALRSRRERVVHLHAELVMQVVGAGLAGCRRLVLTIHNDKPRYRHRVVRWWLGQLARRGVRIVAITDHVNRYLVEQAKVPGAAVRTIRYGVTAPAGRPVRRAELGVSETDFVVGFVGRLTAQKNIELLVRAMAQRPDMTCVIVGEGELGPDLAALSARLGSSNVRFVGAHRDAARLMPAFDVFCLPSLWEGLGVVLLEAMLQHVPIVASRAGAIPEVLDGGRCGVLIDPHSVESLLAGLDRVRHDVAFRRSLVRAAREHVAAAYGVTRMGDETCTLYAQLGAGRPFRSGAAA